MKPRFKVLTLGVGDLSRSIEFYRDGLGLPTDGVIGEEFEHGAVAFFNLDHDMILALYPSESLSHDAGIKVTEARLGAVSIGHIAPTKADVDRIVERAAAVGAVVTDKPRDRFWGGYSGYFHDPDGHLWEIVWHPQWSPLQ
jgi:hypothetical protein